MSRYNVTTYRPKRRSEHAELANEQGFVEERHVVEADDALSALSGFREYMSPEVVTRTQFKADAGSQRDPRQGTVGVYAELATDEEDAPAPRM